MINLGFSLLLLGLMSFSFAKDTITINDYAYGIILENPGNHAVLKFHMPAQVYKKVLHTDLSDVAMFNRDNQLIPWQIIASQAKTKVIRKKIDFFPVLNSQINNNKPTTTVEYIIPLKDINADNIQELEFTWHKTGNHWVAKVFLYVSDDLQNWQQVVQKSISMANFAYAEKMLVRNTLPIGLTLKKQYLLIRLQGKAPKVELQQVVTIANHTENSEKLQRLTLTATRQVASNALIYQSNGYYPAVTLNVDFAEPSSLANIMFYSKAEEKYSAWLYQTSGFFYYLMKNGVLSKSNPTPIVRNTHKQWKLKFVENTIVKKPFPKLIVAWLPDEVIFAAQGPGPYTLAFGSARNSISQNETAMQAIMKQYAVHLKQLPLAKIDKEFNIRGEAALVPATDWKMLGLWVALGIEGLIALWIIGRLCKELKK